MSTEEGIQALYAAAMFSFDGVDVWVNNAGVEQPMTSDQKSLEDWKRIVDVNLTGAFGGCRCALRHFLDHA